MGRFCDITNDTASTSRTINDDLVCTIDLVQAFPEDFELYRRACEAAGARVLSNNYVEQCDGITINWKNDYVCQPKSCTLADNEGLIQSWSNEESTWFGRDTFCILPGTLPTPTLLEPLPIVSVHSATNVNSNDAEVCEDAAWELSMTHLALGTAYEDWVERDDHTHENPSTICESITYGMDVYTGSSGSGYCVKDFNTWPEIQKYKDACVEAGGVTAVLTDPTFLCKGLIWVVRGATLCGDPERCEVDHAAHWFSYMVQSVLDTGVRMGSNRIGDCVDLGGGPIVVNSSAASNAVVETVIWLSFVFASMLTV
mmetsp:Transcript_1397/g.2544  ORF Transcript_1397/g.2544 Transcript_1397/m.2544 type:complete len:313 (+) Transcript_1397:1-939(+)